MMGFGDRFRKLNDDAPDGVPEDEIAATGEGLEPPPPPESLGDPGGEAIEETAATEDPGPEPDAKPKRRLFGRAPKPAPAEHEIAATEHPGPEPAGEAPVIEVPAEPELAATADDAPEAPAEEPAIEVPAEPELAATTDEAPEAETKPKRRLFGRAPKPAPVEHEIAATASGERSEPDDGPDGEPWDPDVVIEIPAPDEAAATTAEEGPAEPTSPPRRRPFSRRPKATRVEDEIAASVDPGDDAPTAEQPAVAEMTATGDAPKRRRPFSRRRKRSPAGPEIAATTAIDEETRRADRASLYGKFRRSGGSRRGSGPGGLDGIPPLMHALNLLPEDRRVETRHFQTKPAHLVLGALIPVALVAVGLMYLSADASKTEKQTERDELSARITALRAQQQQDQQAVAPDALASQALAAGTAQWTSTVATALSERISWDRVLQDANRVLPPDTYFETLAATAGSGSAAGDGAEASGDTAPAETTGSAVGRLTITGFAPDHDTVAVYLRRVETLRDVESATLTSTARAGTLGVLRFIIEAEVRPSR